jgi:thiosulfate/3-mercaptopyruvate sulfurtransferase
MFLTLTLTAVLAAEPAYAKPELLLEPAALLKTPDAFHLIDIRPASAVAEGRINGAAAADLAKWGKTTAEGKADAAFWKTALRAVGVTPTKPTVVYGTDLREVCRAWWLMKYAGVKDVRILNGGFAGYVEAGGKPTTAAPTMNAPAHDWKLDTSRIAMKEDLLQSVQDKATQIVDGRTTGEYGGTQKTAKKQGHVPGANHLEWVNFVDQKSGRFKPAAEIAKLIADSKIDLSKPCTTYCQSGGRSSVVAFSLELMGAKDVRNYYRSWAEWGNANETPVEK